MKKIILVEDDASIRDTFSMVFEAPEYKVTSYETGDELLKNEFEPPDLFVLDKQLSGMDGLDVCRYLKTHQASKDIPVVMISATPGIVRLAKTAGADDALLKPYRLADLRNVVRKYTGKD